MEKAGKMMWKDTVKANWIRARISADRPNIYELQCGIC
jgi:hypothetical protein